MTISFMGDVWIQLSHHFALPGGGVGGMQGQALVVCCVCISFLILFVLMAASFLTPFEF